MRNITLAAAAIAVLAAVTPAGAQSAPVTQRYPANITVSGQGSVSLMPDRVVVSFSIVTNDDSATRATSANNSLYDALAAKLRGLGLDPTAIKTTGYSLSFNQRPAVPSPSFAQRYGYVVTRGVAAQSDRTDQAGTLVDAGVAAGVTSVDRISFGLRDNRSAYRTALTAAVADALSQAQAIAAAAHVRIVRTLSLSAGSYAPSGGLQRIGSVAAMVPTDIQPSDLGLTATVNASYEIAPSP